MQWLRKKSNVLAVFTFGAIAAATILSIIHTTTIHAAGTGTIKGGKYYVSMTLSGIPGFPDTTKNVPIASNNTTLTIAPTANGSKSSIDNGVITFSNVPEGNYNVTATFKETKTSFCSDSVSKNLWGGLLFTAYCALKDGGTVTYNATRTWSGVTVTGGNTTYLDNNHDMTKDQKLGDASETNADGTTRLNCKGDFLVNWVICPMIEHTFDAMDFAMDNLIKPYLTINPLHTTDSNGKQNQLYAIWNNIRNFANLAFILAFFAIIFSQATSFGISNYGIKKLLPKLIVVAIASNLSFFICGFLIDVFNVLGAGVSSLLISAVAGGAPTIDLTGNTVVDTATFAALAGSIMTGTFVIAIPAIFIFIMIAAFIFFASAIVILIRQIFIIFMVLISSLAFVAWLLPNTESLFKKWWKVFINMLAMYPIIMMLFATGKLAGTILSQTGGISSGIGSNTFVALISFLAFILPLIGILFAFKWADGATRKVQGAIHNAGKNFGSKATNTATNLGKKAAMNSKYGQAYQQYMNQRKSIAGARGREYLRGALNRHGSLRAGLGGPGGQQYAARVVEAENRKHRQEETSELAKGLTLPIARRIAAGENLGQALNAGRWANGDQMTAEDVQGVTKLQQQGYLNADGTAVRGNEHAGILANASLQSIFGADDASPDKVEGLASMLEGAGTQANADFSENLRGLAVQGKNKNLAFADVTDGRVDQYRYKSADAVVASGLAGVNKDALKGSTQDANGGGNQLLDAIGRKVDGAAQSVRDNASERATNEARRQGADEQAAVAAGRAAAAAVEQQAQAARNAAIIDIARQTGHIDNEEALTSVARAIQVPLAELKELRQSISSGGAIAPPARFQGSMPSNNNGGNGGGNNQPNNP